VVIFLPGSPDPRGGSVSFVDADRVSPMDSSFIEATNSMRHFGRGSSAIAKTALLKAEVGNTNGEIEGEGE
jgi:hypothetical protein